MTNNWLSASDPYFAQFTGTYDESGFIPGPYASHIAGLRDPQNWAAVAPYLGWAGPIKSNYIGPDGEVMEEYSPKFLNWIESKRAEGYDFVTKADQINQDKQTIGFRTPTGEVVNQQPVKASGFDEFFKEFVIPVATTIIGLPGYGNLNQVIGSAVMGADAAASIGANLGLTGDVVQRAIGSSVINAGLTGAGGGSLEDVVRSGLGSLAAPVVSNVVGQGLGAISPPDFDPNLGSLQSPIKNAAQGALTSGALAAITGASDPADAALGSLTGSAVGALAKETKLPASVIKGALDLANTGEVSPVGLFRALSDIKKQSDSGLPSKDIGADLDSILDTSNDTGALDAGTFFEPDRTEQKAQVADYIREQAASGARGFKVGSDGVLEVLDFDRGLVHRFASDGSALGSVDTVWASAGSTPSAVKEFLATPYVQSLFQGGTGAEGGAGDYLVPEVTGDGAIGGRQESNQTYTDQATRDLEEELAAEELMQVNPPVTLPPTDVDTTTDSGQSVFDQIDQDLGQLALDRQEETRVEQDQEQLRKDAEAAEYEQSQLQQEFGQQGQQAATEIVQPPVAEAAQETVQEPAVIPPAPVVDQPVQVQEEPAVLPPTTATQEQAQETVQTPVQPSTEIGFDEVRQIVSDALQANPSLTEQQVQQVVNGAIQNMPAGLTTQDVAQVVDDAISRLPQGPTTADIDSAVNRAMTDVATKSDVADAIRNIQFPAGINEADVSRAITDYMQQNPGLSAQDVALQVADQLKTLPTYATPADVNAAISGAIANVATRSDIEAAIQGIQFPAGISPSDVTQAISQYMQQNPGLSAQDVADQVGQQLSQLPAYATPADVESAIQGAMTNVATRADVEKAIQGIQFPTGISRADVTDVITDYMQQNPGLSAAEVTSLVGEQLSRLPAYATPQDVESTVRDALAGYATSEDVAGIGRGVEAVRADLTRLIADAQASGLKGDAALNASLEALAGELGMTRQGLLGSLGTTESVLRSEFSSQIGNVQTQMTELGEGLRSAIADAQRAGLRGDDALQLGLESLADRLGTTREELLATLGTNEQSLRSEFASQLGGVSSQISNVQDLLLDKINAAYSVGLQGDEALRAGLDSLATDLGTTQANLLSQLGTTEAALRSQFGSQIGEVRTQVGQLGEDLQAAIEVARRSGLQGDAALQSGLDTLAGSLGTTRSELLSQLGTTEQALRSDFASQLGGVQSQVTQLGSDLSSAIEAARAAGLQGDAALQAGLTSLAGDLGTTKDELLSQLGTTEQGLRADFASQLGGVQTQVTELGADLSSAIESARAAGLQGDAALQAGLDTLANRLGTTTDQLLSQLGTTEQGLRDQFGAQIGEVQTQVGQLSQDLQASIADARSAGLQGDAALQAGLDTLANRLGTTTDQVLSQLGATEQGLRDQFAGQLGEVESSLTGQIGGVEERLNSRIEDLVDQGVDFQTATNQALKEVTGSIETLTEQQQQESEQTQTAIGSVETRLGDRIDQLMQQGLGWQDATDQAIAELSGSVSSLAEETQSSIGALGLDVESQIEELRRIQEADEAAAAEAARQQAAEQKSATDAVARAVQQSAEAAAARDAARAAESAEQSRRSTLAGLATSFMGQGAGSGGVSDPYKATFLKPFIVGGAAPEKFEGPLSGFFKQAMTGDFLPDRPEQSAPAKEDQTMTADQYLGGGEYASNPLDIYQPEQDYAGLYGFRQGGMVPAMAMGGTRYGQNAHGGLSVLEHSGKRRLDYRQGDAVTGTGDGQSDDIPAMLADGEFVIPADVVAALGNGSTKAGSDKLYEMMHNIRRHHRSAGPKDLPPPAKAPLEYIKSRKGRSA